MRQHAIGEERTPTGWVQNTRGGGEGRRARALGKKILYRKKKEQRVVGEGGVIQRYKDD